jgi:hypothetical protein
MLLSPRHAHSGACRRRRDAVGLLGASGAVGDASGCPSEPFVRTQLTTASALAPAAAPAAALRVAPHTEGRGICAPRWRTARCGSQRTAAGADQLHASRGWQERRLLAQSALRLPRYGHGRRSRSANYAWRQHGRRRGATCAARQDNPLCWRQVACWRCRARRCTCPRRLLRRRLSAPRRLRCDAHVGRHGPYASRPRRPVWPGRRCSRRCSCRPPQG